MEKPTSSQEAQTRIQTERLILVFVSQPGCSVCQGLLPQVETVLEEFPLIPSMYIDATELPEAAGQLSVFTAPAVLVFADGKEWFRKARFVPIEELKAQLTKVNQLVNE
ncbi:thioredoxin family protein [Halobacillus salinarum]|uniref:Thioredoxin family protein n=1 Tax=Halobacillus salinarum TaxID=2932257 RepID=A0ABY4EJU4_9BACI|nr:thioredoxin family protein [Halobacillus salinarum]UOQ43889.1 thioredoxin family protein [Halobacillus salinarum]